MYVKDLFDLIRTGENERLEFKSKVNNDLGEEVCALANAFGGLLMIGVDDDGNVVGCDVKASKERISQFITGIVPPVKVTFETVAVDEKRILVVTVPQTKMLCSIGGTAFVRIGNSKRPLSMQEIFMLGAENVLYEMDRTPVHVKSLDHKLVAEFFAKTRGKITDGMDYLKKAGVVLPRGEVTLAGLLFFHRDPQKILPHSAVRLIYPDGKWKRYSGPMWKMVDEAEHDIAAQMAYVPVQAGFKRYDLPEYPPSAVREALVNALTHRNYAIKSETFIEFGQGYLEIRNPGSFPPGTTPENPVPVPRNPLIYELMFQAGYVERQGRGVDLIRRECGSHPFVTFAYTLRPNQTVIRFERGVKGLSDDQQLILQALASKEMSSSELARAVGKGKGIIIRRVEELMQMRLVKKRGKGPGVRYTLGLSDLKMG